MKRLLFILFPLFFSCSQEKAFVHDISTPKKPWTKEINYIKNDLDFTFAIISDLNGGEREGVFSDAVNKINLLVPDFVLSVGDLIDGGTENDSILLQEWESFDLRASQLQMPFFYLPGNHDISNPVMRDFWKNKFGRRYYHFIYKNVLFLMMDSEDFNDDFFQKMYLARDNALKILSGEVEGNYEETEYFKMDQRVYGEFSDDQIDYFTEVLDKYSNIRWIYLLMHKPVWMKENSEFKKIENILKDKNYTVINGHLHSFSHKSINGNSYITLGTTGGSQKQGDSNAFDHFTYINIKENTPYMSHIKLDGILNSEGKN